MLVALRKTEKSNNSLVSHYLKANSFDSQNNQNNSDNFYKILKFLSFIRRLNGSRHFIGNQLYYLINFSLIEFLEFTKVKNKNQYQRQKALEFIASLGLILNKYKLVSKKGEYQVVSKLKIKSITKIKYIYFYQSISY